MTTGTSFDYTITLPSDVFAKVATVLIGGMDYGDAEWAGLVIDEPDVWKSLEAKLQTIPVYGVLTTLNVSSAEFQCFDVLWDVISQGDDLGMTCAEMNAVHDAINAVQGQHDDLIKLSIVRRTT